MVSVVKCSNCLVQVVPGSTASQSIYVYGVIRSATNQSCSLVLFVVVTFFYLNANCDILVCLRRMDLYRTKLLTIYNVWRAQSLKNVTYVILSCSSL